MLENSVLALREEASVELAETTAFLGESYRVRYQVYCAERGFLPGRRGIECDEYDAFSRHAVVRLRQPGVVVGTVRLVLPKTPAGGDDFPIQHVCHPALLRDLPLATTGEVSRFTALTSDLVRQLLLQPRSGTWIDVNDRHVI